ncbi:MAG: hypothetical protein PHH01_01300 [Patescibacteria group bacterium]|nr:hypothetical protein [Patescibacteria group bacterium]
MFFLILTGCAKKTDTSNDNKSANSGNQNQGSGITDRTDYVVFYQGSTPPVVAGGVATTTYIVGRPVPEAETIKNNAYFVPWKIYFSQVQSSSQILIGSGCNTTKDQVVYIDGWIDLNLTDLEVGPNDLPSEGPAKPSGTVHETVTGEPGNWVCGSDTLNYGANQGSIDYIKSVTGTHTANFSDASNLTNMKVSGADIYLDLSMPEDVQFIWPAGTKIEYAPEGTPIPLEPLSPSQL